MWIFAGIFFLAVAILVWIGVQNARRVQVRHQKFFAKISTPVSVVHWTDLHVGWGMPATAPRIRGVIQRVVDSLRTEQVCSIFTGDLVNHFTRLSRFDLVLREFSAMPGPKFFVLGNHDVRHNQTEKIVQLLQRHGFKMLKKLPVRWGQVQLQGTADFVTQREQVTGGVLRELEKIPDQPVRVLATHNLDALPESTLGKLKNTLVLAGHTHGVVLFERVYRVVRKITFGALKRFDYRSPIWTGHAEVGKNSIAAVSNGVGMHTIPMRFGAEPQVVVWEIEKTC